MLPPLLYLWTHEFKYKILFYVAGDLLLNLPVLTVFPLTQSEYLFTFPLTSSSQNHDSSNCQNRLLISGLSFKHFKSGFIFLSLASCQDLVIMLHWPCKAFCLPGTGMLSLCLSHQRKLSLFEVLSHPHATCCLSLHITNLLTI